MHRNQQRKEEHLDRIKHLRHLNNDSPQETSDERLLQDSQQSQQHSSQHSSQNSSKQQLVRGLSRNSRHDFNNSTNDSTFGSQLSVKSKSNRNMSLRSVKSPSVSSQLMVNRNGLHSNTHSIQSSKLKPNVSLPQTLSSHSVCSQNSNNKSLSSTTTEPNISPEILFLIKEQAKAIAKINALQKKVDQLEQTVNYQSISNCNNNSTHELSHEVLNASSSTTKSVNNNSNNNNNSKERNVISDDSGGEYSRATTITSDEDELSSLLDRIARCSQQLNYSQQQNKFTNESNSNRLLSQSMQMRQKLMYSLSNPTLQMSDLSRSSTVETTQDMNRYINSNCNNKSYQPISALLFEPNVDNVLKNIDEMIGTQTITNNNCNTTSNMTPTYHENHTLAQHSSSPSLYEAIGIRQTPFSPSLSAINRSKSSTNSRLDRVKSIIKEREEREFESQMRLNDEWLETQLKGDSNKPKRITNFIDSLESTFR